MQRGYAMPLVKVKTKGQITLPHQVRKRLGLSEGDLIEIDIENGHGVIIPQRLVPATPAPKLSTKEQKTLETTRKKIAAIQKEKANPNFKIFPSLPYKDFLALEREAAVWAGNSSAGMIEASSFGTPVVNIGTRQLGREHGLGVINVGCDRKEIKSAIRDSLFDRKYRKKLLKTKNPWGDGKSAERVVKILERLPLDKKLLVKQLTYD